LHAANQGLTAISTEPPCTQLTPSSAERARRERRHPKASTAEKSLALDPLENGIDVDRTFIDDRPSHQSGGDFDVARAGWIGDYSDPQNFLFLFESGNGKFD
jgi:ABC-type oligopeptide transport system substrate-binding subunit